MMAEDDFVKNVRGMVCIIVAIFKTISVTHSCLLIGRLPNKINRLFWRFQFFLCACHQINMNCFTGKAAEVANEVVLLSIRLLTEIHYFWVILLSDGSEQVQTLYH